MEQIDTNELRELKGLVNAIQRSQAVIEFDLQGNILTANDNFLAAMGYTLSEIQGNHHSLFVDDEYARSAAYRDFWADFSNGQFSTGEFERFGKGGRQIWIQATYSPILDESGTPYKVIKTASDITAQKKLAEDTSKLMQDAGRVISALAAGDLTDSMCDDYDGEMATLSDNLNTCVANLANMTSQIHGACDGMARSASEINQGNQNLSNRTEQQASSLEETAASMEQLTSTVKQNADNAKEATQLALGARDEAEKGGSVVSGAIDAMTAINESSKEISDIIGVIEEIAFQTNLLALNAAVEAARAGEQGRGFAVVASEVRNLAQRSSSAAKEITALIKDSVNKVEEGSKLVDASGESLAQIVDAVRKVSGIVEEISAASEEQATGIQQVSSAVQQMDQMTQENAALVEEVAAASTSMDDDARNMQGLISYFKLSGAAAAPSAQVAATPVVSKPEVKTPPRRRMDPPVEPPVAPPPSTDSASGDSGWAEF